MLSFNMFAADIWLVGDSTMCDYPRNSVQQGWGTYLQQFCKKGVKVYNCAKGGRSTKSFREQGFWEKMIVEVKEGDFVLLGMAINDSANKKIRPQNHTELGGEFEGNLKQYIKEIRQKGAIPMLTTSTVIYSANGLTRNAGTLRKYNEAIILVAKETGTDIVDLNDCAFQKIKAMQFAEVYPMYMASAGTGEQKNDYCHTKAKGALFFSDCFVQLCQKDKLPIAALLK